MPKDWPDGVRVQPSVLSLAGSSCTSSAFSAFHWRHGLLLITVRSKLPPATLAAFFLGLVLDGRKHQRCRIAYSLETSAPWSTSAEGAVDTQASRARHAAARSDGVRSGLTEVADIIRRDVERVAYARDIPGAYAALCGVIQPSVSSPPAENARHKPSDPAPPGRPSRSKCWPARWTLVRSFGCTGSPIVPHLPEVVLRSAYQDLMRLLLHIPGGC